MKRATVLTVSVRRLSWSIFSHFCRNSAFKCALQPKIAKNTKSLYLGFQGHSKSSMLIPLNSSSPVLVMISSMSMPICNCFPL